MHQMRLTNKQIQESLADMRRQLKLFKTTGNAMNINFKFPEITEHPRAKLIIQLEAWLKMIALISECDKEIAWHGVVRKDRHTYIIEDILIFPQTVTGATVTSDETEYSLWLAQQPDEIFNKLRFHGHSHVNMGVSPSGVDTTYQDDIIRNLNDFYIFGIFNKKGDNWCTIYDVEDNIVYEDKDIDLITPDSNTIGWAQAAIKEYVNIPKAKKAATKKTPLEEKEEEEYIYGLNDPFYSSDGYYRYYGGFGGNGQK